MSEMKKVVYEDDGVKIVKGIILKDEEFTIEIKTEFGAIVTIGKRAIIRIYDSNSGGWK